MEAFDDILGGIEPTPRSMRQARLADQPERSLLTTPGSRGKLVSVDWLSRAFDMTKPQITAALKNCPAVRNAGVTSYDIALAAPYLITLDPKRLPDKMRETYWNAKTKEMKYKTLAGELWPTEAVMENYADTFQIMASKVKLFADDLEEIGELTEVQRKFLMQKCDDLLEEVRESLIDRMRTKQSFSYAAEGMDE